MSKKPSTNKVALRKDTLDAFMLMKHYDEMAVKAKGRVWTITTWILALNSGIIALCFELFSKRSSGTFLLLEVVFCIVGVALCIFNLILINDLGEHIRRYWDRSKKIVATDPYLMKLTGWDEAPVPFPRFCRRLKVLVWMFIVGFVGIAILMAHWQLIWP